VYWNERLGKVKADDLALIASDVNGGGTGTDLSQASYTQNRAFRQTLEFAQEAYNYKTTSDDDPSNLVLLCTTQGMAIQQDGNRVKTIYHHVKEHGRVSRYWLEAESSSHKVGGSQVETKEENEDALERGKATSSVIGTKAIGTRFNMLMTIQVPLKQKDVKPHAEYYYMATECSDFFGSAGSAPMVESGSLDCFGSVGSAFCAHVQKGCEKKVGGNTCNNKRKVFCSQGVKRQFR
jgi:hypothetical protein